MSIKLAVWMVLVALSLLSLRQGVAHAADDLGSMALPKDYAAHRQSGVSELAAHDGRLVLMDHRGSGEIRHIWIGLNANQHQYLRKMVVRMYWDGEEAPSVEAPLGDFFGVGHARRARFSCAVMNTGDSDGNTDYPPSIWCGNFYFPMPFSTHARIVLDATALEPKASWESVYWHIDYQEKAIENRLRFHAQWRRENPTQAVPNGRETGEDSFDKNYVILDAAGAGHYAGCNLSVRALEEDYWVGGGDQIVVDGANFASSVMGLEDYIGFAFGLRNMQNPYQGVSLFDDTPGAQQAANTEWTVYRYHIPDPIPFKESIKVTTRHGEFNYRADDYSSTAYWYQTEPHKPFPPLPTVAQRLVEAAD